MKPVAEALHRRVTMLVRRANIRMKQVAKTSRQRAQRAQRARRAAERRGEDSVSEGTQRHVEAAQRRREVSKDLPGHSESRFERVTDHRRWSGLRRT